MALVYSSTTTGTDGAAVPPLPPIAPPAPVDIWERYGFPVPDPDDFV